MALQDIEELVLSCRSDQSKEYITEAVASYQAGAYRASIVGAWIAVVFDLVDKVRELSLAGDATAKALETQYENYLDAIDRGDTNAMKMALEFERTILETCKDRLQFFDSHQYIDLQRLKSDRHRCAHPSFLRAGEPYRASAEQARLHLRNAITHVLAQAPIRSKSALTELKLKVASQYFPTRAQLAFDQLKASPLDVATEALVNAFVDCLVFGVMTPGDSLYRKPQAIAALNAVKLMHPSTVELRLGKRLNVAVRDVSDQDLVTAVVLIAHVGQAWDFLDTASRGKVTEYVKKGPAHEVIRLIKSLSSVPELIPDVTARISGFTLEELADGIAEHDLGVLAKNAALNIVEKSSSFNAANSAINKLIFPIFDYLTKADFERIIRAPTDHGADLIGATSYEALIEKLYLGTSFAEQELGDLLRANRAGYLALKHKGDTE